MFHLCLFGMTLEMTYFRAELLQLTVGRSDSELEVERYGRKKNTLTVDPIMLEDELWMRQEKPSPNWWSWFLKTKLWKLKFSVFEFWGQFGSVFRKPISDIFNGFRTPTSGTDKPRHGGHWQYHNINMPTPSIHDVTVACSYVEKSGEKCISKMPKNTH